MEAGVVCDTYKVVTFKKHLDEAGFKYREFPNAGHDFSVLHVEYENHQLQQLKAVVSAADEAAKKLSRRCDSPPLMEGG